MSEHGSSRRGSGRFAVGMAAGLIGLALICSLGCRQADEPPAAPPPDSTAERQTASSSSDSQAASGAAAAATEPVPKGDPQKILQSMVAAYKGVSSYNDQGSLKITGKSGSDPIEDQFEYLVVWEGPNKVRVQIGPAIAMSDGASIWATVPNLPNQVLKKAVGEKVDLTSLYADHELAAALIQGPTQTYSWVPVQLILLWANDPLKTFLHQAEDTTLLPIAEIENRKCYRVQVKRFDGTSVFWIDQENHLLRRLEFPTNALREIIPADQISDLAMVADFTGAQVNGQVDPRAFQYQLPEGIATVDALTPPELMLLGKPAPDFKFVDPDGKEVTLATLSGKPAVLDLWATWCQPCRQLMPLLNEVYKEHGARVNFYAVSVDDPSMDDRNVADAMKAMNVDIPLVRDKEQTAKVFQYAFIPTTIVLDGVGVVQEYRTGGTADLDAQLSAHLERLLAGDDLYTDGLAQYDAQKEAFRQLRQQAVDDDLFTPLVPTEQTAPRAEILPRSEPETLKLAQLWRSSDVKAPGNILVVQNGGTPQIVVLDGESEAVEINAEGKAIARHALIERPIEAIRFLRTATDKDGKRYFVGSSSPGQQLHLFDEQFKRLMSYPEDAADNPYGIGDVRIADLDGDGTPEICAGFWNVAGVHCVSLEGERLWRNRSVANAFRVAVLGADTDGQRLVLVTNTEGPGPGTLKTINSKGEAVGDVAVPDRNLAWLAAADLNEDQQPEICALAAMDDSNLEAIGFDVQGNEQWKYPLPRGAHEQPIDPIASGPVVGDEPDEWIFASADSTIHILTSDGALVDRFAYGAPLTGIAAARFGGKNVLLVATTEGLDAWEVKPPE